MSMLLVNFIHLFLLFVCFSGLFCVCANSAQDVTLLSLA